MEAIIPSKTDPIDPDSFEGIYPSNPIFFVAKGFIKNSEVPK